MNTVDSHREEPDRSETMNGDDLEAREVEATVIIIIRHRYLRQLDMGLLLSALNSRTVCLLLASLLQPQ